MTNYAEFAIGDLFEAVNGRAKFIRDYMDTHAGPYPVYSASLVKPFGFVNEYEFEGRFLTWVMNGYGGRVQEVDGRFSANRDRGVLIPRPVIEDADLTYLRFAMEPQLVAAAVGRRVDGRLNEYTKIYPQTALEQVIRIPIDSMGNVDLDRMKAIGSKLRRIEASQVRLREVHETLARATSPFLCDPPTRTISLGDESFFRLSIGNRVLRSQHVADGVPVYSANARSPFGNVESSNLEDFTHPSLLWGIDGIFDWNLIPPGVQFATTDHCGRAEVLDSRLDPAYLLAYLRTTRNTYGFDRVFRASLRNMKANVEVTVPVDANGELSLSRQKELAVSFYRREEAQLTALASISDVLDSRMAVDL
ncbi:restriction endonuclease subunit S [Streptomyces albidoflavus]|uniref:restriction endonuclease subunit S n=1 Tax=Streptomyces albidoflavus TaxID=1886 RepID=UPI00340B6532